MKSKDIAKYKNIDEFLGITIYSSVMQSIVELDVLGIKDLLEQGFNPNFGASKGLPTPLEHMINSFRKNPFYYLKYAHIGDLAKCRLQQYEIAKLLIHELYIHSTNRERRFKIASVRTFTVK